MAGETKEEFIPPVSTPVPAGAKSFSPPSAWSLRFRGVMWRLRSLVMSMAALSLVILVVQNSALGLMTRYSRFAVPKSELYYTSTLVLNQEIVKLLVCFVALYYERKGEQEERGEPVMYWRHLKEVVWHAETWKLALPAALFTLQNFLIFVSLSNLDVMTFQVVSQVKLLTAAVFSVWLLDRHLNFWQWMSLFILSFGIILAQAQGSKETVPNRSGLEANIMVGVVSCVISGLSSSFAGVYFEKVVKTTAPSLAIRNIHLSIFGVPFAALTMYVLDVYPNPSKFDFWRGYGSWLTWSLVMVHAGGGLLVAVVVKYADNILKGFATGIAIITSGFVTAMLWGYVPTVSFLVGCVLVVGSSILYHIYDAPVRPRSPIASPKEEV